MSIHTRALPALSLTLALMAPAAQSATKIELDNYGWLDAGNTSWGYLGTSTYGADDPLLIDVTIGNFGRTASVFYEFGGDFFFFLFVNSVNAPLTTGLYDDARARAVEGHPGLRISMNGSAFSSLTGAFQVVELGPVHNSTPQSFAASFIVDTIPGYSGPVMSGRIWFNSEAHMPAVPEPQGIALVLAGVATAAGVARVRRQPSS